MKFFPYIFLSGLLLCILSYTAVYTLIDYDLNSKTNNVFLHDRESNTSFSLIAKNNFLENTTTKDQ